MHRPALLLVARCLSAGPAIAQSAPDSLPPLRVVDTSYIDRSASACTDFSQFANGAWLRRDTIPAAYAVTGVGKDMTDRNEAVVHALLEETAAAARDPAGGQHRAEAGDLLRHLHGLGDGRARGDDAHRAAAPRGGRHQVAGGSRQAIRRAPRPGGRTCCSATPPCPTRTRPGATWPGSRPGRARHAGPRLLHRRRGRSGLPPPVLRRARRQVPHPDRAAGVRGPTRRQRDHGPRDRIGARFAHPGPAPRSRRHRPPHAGRALSFNGAARGLAVVFQDHRAHVASEHGQRGRARVLRAGRYAPRHDTARHLAGVPQVPHRRARRLRAQHAVRPGGLRLPVTLHRGQGARSRAGSGACGAPTADGRGAGAGLRRQDLLARGTRPGQGGDRRHPAGVRGAASSRLAWMSDSTKARALEKLRRMGEKVGYPDAVARLLQARGGGGAVRAEPARGQPRSSGGGRSTARACRWIRPSGP